MIIKDIIQSSQDLKQQVLQDEKLLAAVQQVINEMITCFRNGGRVLFCGNGGSAADAQHLAAEFSGRFYYDRAPLDSEALHVNTSYLTAVANDYSYDLIYARLVRAKGHKGDVLVGLSTSGNSKNIIEAFKVAEELGMKTVAMTGQTGGLMKDLCNYLVNVPSNDTPRIQEVHILLGHIMCQLVEADLFPQK